MLYKCQLCDKEFNKKSNYISHINKKNPCNKLEEEKLTCENCNIKFSRSDSLLRHLKKCKCNSNINEINKKIDNLIEENKQLKEKINRLENQNIIVNLIDFCNEDIKNLNDNEINKILFDENNDQLIEIIKNIHFNDRLLCQKNIKYTNIKSNYIYIFKNNKWHLELLNNFLTILIDNHLLNLDLLYNKYNIDNKFKKYNNYTSLDIKDKLKIRNRIKLFIFNESKK